MDNLKTTCTIWITLITLKILGATNVSWLAVLFFPLLIPLFILLLGLAGLIGFGILLSIVIIVAYLFSWSK